MTDAAQDLYKQAQAHAKEGRLDDALKTLEQSLSAGETAPALHDTGIIHYMKGDRNRAVLYLQEAVLNDPSYAQGYANLARIMFEGGQMDKAIEYSCMAVKAAPGDQVAKEDFAKIVSNKGFAFFYPALKETLLACLETEKLTHQNLLGAWISTVRLDPALAALTPLFAAGDYKTFRKKFSRLKDIAPLFDPILIQGIRRLVIADHEFERLLTHLRHLLLDALNENLFAGLGTGGLELASAIAIYCFYTDYIFDIGDDERARADRLKQGVESGTVSDPAAICVLGAYLPLCTLTNADALLQTQDMDELLRVQVREPRMERDIRAGITALTPIEDSVSSAVRDQYEEFPYPKWKSIDTVNFFNDLGEDIPRGARFLVAGCGTGQESARFALAYPQAHIVAVDLSLSSLAYAIRATRALGADNIAFHQADILKLDFPDPFDIISCSGVLHHMRDPEAGWSVLTRLLKPGGRMRIALYSELGRPEVAAARAVIAAKHIPGDRDGIRAFRRQAHRLLKENIYQTLLNRRDYYSMPECRDLLFHVQERRYQLHEIDAMIGRQGLEFAGFNLPGETMALYRHENPQDPQAMDLEAWAKFERRHPETFIGMFNFWCRKPA